MPGRGGLARAVDDRSGGVVAAHRVDSDGEQAAMRRNGSADVDDDAVSCTSRTMGHTTCGSLAAAQRGQTLRGGCASFHAPARRLRDFDLDFFFLGTATVGLPPWIETVGGYRSKRRFGSTVRKGCIALSADRAIVQLR